MMFRWISIASLGALCACAAPQRERFRIDMQTQTDDGKTLAGVTVWHGEQSLGETTSSAQLAVDVEAVGGSNFEVRYDCPTGYTRTRDRVLVPLRTASNVAEINKAEVAAGEEIAGEAETPAEPSAGANTYALTLECRPNKRNAMVVVRTNMANVPIKIGNETKGKTNSEGIAYLALNYSPKEVFEVSLETAADPFLRPINPEFPFVMPDHDEVFVLQEAFHIEEPPPVVVKKKKKKKKAVVVEEVDSRPVRINAGEGQWGIIKRP